MYTIIRIIRSTMTTIFVSIIVYKYFQINDMKGVKKFVKFVGQSLLFMIVVISASIVINLAIHSDILKIILLFIVFS